jgi:hypothetical protein
VKLLRRAVATCDEIPPATTEFRDEIRHTLQQTPPFLDSGEAHLRDGHTDSSRRFPCPHRPLLEDAMVEALVLYGVYWADWIEEIGGGQPVLDALSLIGGVLDTYYPKRRNKKLHGQYDAVAEAVLRLTPKDRMQRHKLWWRDWDRTKRTLTNELYKAFLQYGPSQADYRREAIYWAIATILTAYELEAGAITDIAYRIKKRCLHHTRSAE